MPEDLRISAALPGEALAIEIVKLIRVIVEGQDPEVRREHSRMWLEDLKAWREFWKGVVKP